MAEENKRFAIELASADGLPVGWESMPDSEKRVFAASGSTAAMIDLIDGWLKEQGHGSHLLQSQNPSLLENTKDVIVAYLPAAVATAMQNCPFTDSIRELPAVEISSSDIIKLSAVKQR